MDRTLDPSRVQQPPTRRFGRFAASFAIGALVVPLLGPFVPGPAGAFTLLGAMGMAGVLILPGWAGFLATAAGLLTFTLASAAVVAFAGLHFLWLVFLLPALAAGSCAGAVANAIRARGTADALRDARVWTLGALGLLLAVGLAGCYVVVAGSGSPP